MIVYRKVPSFNTLNAALKSITTTEAVNGFKIDLSGQVSEKFQLGGNWQYSTAESSFTLNTAILTNAMSQDSNFIAATYHDNGKLESRGMALIGDSLSASAELMFQGPDTRRAYYAVEVSKKFAHSTASVKFGTGQYSFTYMQALTNNIFGGFECSYMVL